MREPRVLHVIANLERGGAQELLCTLAECRPAPAEILVCTLADGPLRARLEAGGALCRVVPGPRVTFARPVRWVSELRKVLGALAACVEEWGADIVQTHLLPVLDPAILSLHRTPRAPGVIWTFHGTDVLPLRPGRSLPLRRLACRARYRHAARRVDAIVAVSEAVRESVARQLGAVAGGRTRVIENAPSPRKHEPAGPTAFLRQALGLDADARVVLSVGRLSAEKGCRRLVEAMPAVAARVPAAVAMLAGDGPERRDLEALARHTGVADRVRFLGDRDDVAGLLAVADVVCLPSEREGMSLSILEAMAAGRAVVALDIRANRSLVEDGVTGVLVSPLERGALARCVADLLSDPVRADALGRAARARVLSRHDPWRQAGLYAELHRDVLAARTRR
ncbi:MAG TPA: glycosyltransferase family 4 protein [Thermoanaerobaculia bacterium]|nr:glycosyltransferase family 4 protein [Thermoanaerobaculia bacterium]